MNRRRWFLLGGLAAAGLYASYAWPEDGFGNPCLQGLPEELARHPLVQAAWEGVDPAGLWDCHVHLVGSGDSGSGAYLNPRLSSWTSPVAYLRTRLLFDASCVRRDSPSIDRDFLGRLHNLVEQMPAGVKLMLLAFDEVVGEGGVADPGASDFHTPDEFAALLAVAAPQRFEWICSIHPYRPEAVARLRRAAAAGARAVKWLPAAMGMDPASPRCDKFYDTLVELRLPLLSHAGAEHTVDGARRPELGNPLRLRRPLERGVRVIVAHCASDGSDLDLDSGSRATEKPSFELFTRLFDDPAYRDRLYGDLSAIIQVNRSPAAVQRLLERDDWHTRLLYGSDYPLPGVFPLISVRRLVSAGFLAEADEEPLRLIRRHNPLLFDFVLKRRLASRGRRFATAAFDTRRVFAP